MKGIKKKLMTSIRYFFFKLKLKFLYLFKMKGKNRVINQLLKPTNLIMLHTEMSDDILLIRLKDRSFKMNIIEEIRKTDMQFAKRFRKELRMKYLDVDTVYKYIVMESNRYVSEFQIIDRRDIAGEVNITKREINYVLI